jgi:hypothetical protein
MQGIRKSISLIIVLVLMVSVKAISQIPESGGISLKPTLNYSLGSSFIAVPHFGTLTGFTISPALSVPISPKLSVEGGIIAGRYFSTLKNFNPEIPVNGTFNVLSIYGSALYHVNPQLTIYGSGIKQLTGNTPYNYLPKSSYTIGTTYNFGSFSIGASVQMNQWDNFNSPMPFNGSPGYFMP